MEQGGKGASTSPWPGTSSTSSSTSGPLDRGRRGALEREVQASVPDRSGRPPGAESAGRPRLGAGAALRPPGPGGVQLPQRAVQVRLEGQQVGAEPRQGEPDPRGRGLEEGSGRHPRQGRQEAQDGLPDLDQRRSARRRRPSSSRPPPRRASRSRSSRWWRRCSSRPTRQLGHVPSLLDRPPDVHDHHDPSRPAAAHGPVHVVGSGVQGEQVAQPQSHAVAQRGVRQALEVGRRGDGSRQAGGHVHPDERPRWSRTSS